MDTIPANIRNMINFLERDRQNTPNRSDDLALVIEAIKTCKNDEEVQDALESGIFNAKNSEFRNEYGIFIDKLVSISKGEDQGLNAREFFEKFPEYDQSVVPINRDTSRKIISFLDKSEIGKIDFSIYNDDTFKSIAKMTTNISGTLWVIDRVNFAVGLYFSDPFRRLRACTALVQSLASFFPVLSAEDIIPEENVTLAVDTISQAAAECAEIIASGGNNDQYISVDMAWLHRLCTFLLYVCVQSNIAPPSATVTLASVVTLSPSKGGKANKSARLLAFMREQQNFRCVDGSSAAGVVGDWLRWEAKGYFDANTQLSTIAKVKNAICFMQRNISRTGATPSVESVAEFSGLSWAKSSDYMKNHNLFFEQLRVGMYRSAFDLRAAEIKTAFLTSGVDGATAIHQAIKASERYDALNTEKITRADMEALFKAIVKNNRTK